MGSLYSVLMLKREQGKEAPANMITAEQLEWERVHHEAMAVPELPCQWSGDTIRRGNDLVVHSLVDTVAHSFNPPLDPLWLTLSIHL